MWVTMKTPVASVRNSLLEFSAASNLGKCAGIPTRPFSSSIPGVCFSPVLIIEDVFFASVQVRACAAVKTVDLSRPVRPVTQRQTVREPACVQVCPPSVPSPAPRRTSRCAV